MQLYPNVNYICVKLEIYPFYKAEKKRKLKELFRNQKDKFSYIFK
jgi:hypothetical protein